MVDYQGKKITIIGLGITGRSCIDFFLSRKIVPRVIDTRTIVPNFNSLNPIVKYHFGNLNRNWLLSSDLIVISPSISLKNPVLIEVLNKGIEIISDIELFCREAKVPIIAITGSNGKSTVTTLVGEMAKESGINVGIGGNIGIPALKLLSSNRNLYILEISSFQLETTFSLNFSVATVLNVTEDHMDRYPFGLQQYLSVKLRIYKNSKICVINSDDPLTIPTSYKKKCFVRFGTRNSDYCLNCFQGETWICIRGKNVINTKNILLFGHHNYINVLSALALADSAGLPRESSLKALTNFVGLPHRFQKISKKGGITWINDSKSTNVASTKAALSSINIINGKIHLLLGGDSKSADFSPLIPFLSNKKIQMYCFGKDRKKIASLFPDRSKQIETLEQVMYLLSFKVKEGDIVLFSPACASFDQFENFEQRGLFFINLLKKLNLNGPSVFLLNKEN